MYSKDSDSQIRIEKSPTMCGERNPKKVARTQPTKNTEKASVVKALRWNFPLHILGLARDVFFYHLKKSIKIQRYNNKLCGFIVIIMNVMVILCYFTLKTQYQS